MYDCDFNQITDLPVADKAVRHIRDVTPWVWPICTSSLSATGNHCYGCAPQDWELCGGNTGHFITDFQLNVPSSIHPHRAISFIWY